VAFHENAIFPTNISRGSRGGPIFRHSVLELDSGQPSVVSRWPTARRRYNAAYGIKRFADLQVVHDFWLGRGGISNGWRWFDLFDHSTAADHRGAPTATDVEIGTGDGSTTIFSMLKLYTSFDQTVTRVIEKPIDGTALVAVNSVTQTEGADYTIDYSSGEIAFTLAPSAGLSVSWGGEYHVPCQFAPDLDDAFEVSIDAFEAGAIPDIPILEMLGNTTTPEQPWRGGGSALALTADTLYDWSNGHALYLVPDASGHKLILPYRADLDPGGPIFHLYNSDAAFTIPVHSREAGALEFTLPAETGAIVITYDISGTLYWKGLKGV